MAETYTRKQVDFLVKDLQIPGDPIGKVNSYGSATFHVGENSLINIKRINVSYKVRMIVKGSGDDDA